MDATGGFIGLIFVVIFTIALFLVFRAIVLWYWKVDKVVALLESIDKKLGPSPSATEKAGPSS